MVERLSATILFLWLASLGCRVATGSEPMWQIDNSFTFYNTNFLAVNDVILLPGARIAAAGEGKDPKIILPETGGSNAVVRNFISHSVNSLAVHPNGGTVAAGSGSFLFDRFSERWEDFWYDTFPPQQLGEARKVFVREDGTIVGAGRFVLQKRAPNVPWSGLVALTSEGQVIPSFNTLGSVELSFLTAEMDDAGRILGSYTQTNSASEMRHGMGRWLENGDRDPSFVAPAFEPEDPTGRVSLLKRFENGVMAVWESGPTNERTSRIFELSREGKLVRPVGPEFEGQIRALAFLQPAPPRISELMVGGSFSRVGDAEAINLALLREDGAVEEIWETGQGPSGPVHALAVQPNGRVLVGGRFDRFGETPVLHLVRLRQQEEQSFLYWSETEYHGFEKLGEAQLTLKRSGNVDGELRVSLQVASSPSGRLGAIPEVVVFAPAESEMHVRVPLLQDQLANGPSSHRFTVSTDGPFISRAETTLQVLDDDVPGTLDPSFPLQLISAATALAVQPDGKVLIGGFADGPRVFRLNYDGDLDPTFATNGLPTVLRGAIQGIKVLPDGRIFVGGDIGDKLTGLGRNHLIRLNPNGTLDPSFSLNRSRMYPWLYFDVQPDGRPVIAPENGRLERLTLSGGTDGAPAIVTGTTALAVLNNTDSLIARERKVQRLQLPGQVVPSFSLSLSNGWVRCLRIEGEHVLIGGAFSNIDGHAIANLVKARISDGLIDTSFAPRIDGEVREIVRDHYGRYYIRGFFLEVGGQPRIRLARLHADGSLDAEFDPGRGFWPAPMAMALQPNGKLLAGGDFETLRGVQSTNMVQLEAGTNSGYLRFSSKFIQAGRAQSNVTISVERVGGSAGSLSGIIEIAGGSASEGAFLGNPVEVQYAGGEHGFKIIELIPPPRIETIGHRSIILEIAGPGFASESTIMLDDERVGTLDDDFRLETGGSNSSINDFAVAGDGSIWIAGQFSSLNGVPVTNLAKLNPDMSVDPSASSYSLAIPALTSLALDAQGRLLAGGSFIRIGFSNWSGLIRINPDRSFDTAFNAAARSASISAPAGIYPLEDGGIFTTGTRLQTVSDFGTVPSGFPSLFNPLAFLPISPSEFLFADQNNGVRKFGRDGAAVAGFKFNTRNTRAMALDGNGGILLATEAGGRVIRVYPDGTQDIDYIANVGVNPSFSGSGTVYSILAQPSGSAIVGGTFRWLEGREQPGLALIGPRGEARWDFHPNLVGVTNVTKIVQLPGQGLLLRAVMTNESGIAMNRVLKLRYSPELPPIAAMVFPTNGAAIRISQGAESFRAIVQANDPDGAVAKLTVLLNGELLLETNRSRLDLAVPVQRLNGEGPHLIELIAEDMYGLRDTNAAAFTLTRENAPLRLSIVRREDGAITVLVPSGELFESDDLRDWRAVTGLVNGAYRFAPDRGAKFFHARE